ncbi:MAG: glyoxylate/hydroxypyruvate reductase A [Pseudomonadota bacterium]
MSPTVLFAGRAEQRQAYHHHLTRAASEAGIAINLAMDPADCDPGAVHYLIFAGNGPVQDFRPFRKLKAILSLWAGVETLLTIGPPDGVAVVRMVEPGLTQGMIDYVVGHTLRHHLEIDRYLGTEPIAVWETDYPPLAQDRRVSILGLGTLGTACAIALSDLGFAVAGWSRRPKTVPGVTCLSGPEGLADALTRADILVLLLPLTAMTERVLNAERLARLPQGACVINAGREPLIDHGALIAALDKGHLRHATMDVFDIEPLPPTDPYWAHPKVTVTPHIASVTRPETAAVALIESIRRAEAGEPLENLVNSGQGY